MVAFFGKEPLPTFKRSPPSCHCNRSNVFTTWPARYANIGINIGMCPERNTENPRTPFLYTGFYRCRWEFSLKILSFVKEGFGCRPVFKPACFLR